MISVVIPAFNEADNINVIARSVSGQLIDQGDTFEIIFVDDGSSDSTLVRIKKLAAVDSNIRYISFSRNFGHQKALMAGYDHASGDCVISMDADMQHPPELLKDMIAKWKEGFDVVYTIRRDTKQTGKIKKLTSRWFYKAINRLCDIEIPAGAADFRLLDRRVVNEIIKIREEWIFMRGVVVWLGFRQIGIEYDVQKRNAGESKYTFGKMFGFAIQGITSFSIVPLRMASFLGAIISVVAFLYIVYALYARMVLGIAIEGWTSILISVLLLGGVQLIVLGVLGEYLGKMFIETKHRPSYVIRDKNIIEVSDAMIAKNNYSQCIQDHQKKRSGK